MEHIDPRTITGQDWSFLADLVGFPFGLWGLVFFNVLFAGSMMLAHIVIPSLIATGHIPASVDRSRPIFTALALLSLVGSAVAVLTWLGTLPVLYDIYPKRII